MDTPESREQALKMLETLASVGVTDFDVTMTDIDGAKQLYRPRQSLPQIKPAIPYFLGLAGQRHHNFIIRPHQPKDVSLVQLDDLDAKAVARVHDLALLTVQTSPGNYQSWIAVQGGDADLARRFRKGMGADVNASGAVRMPGTLNFKAAYKPLFPIVSLVSTQPGRIATPEEIAPFLAAEQERPTWVERVTPSKPRRWPDYARELQKAPLNHSKTGPDRSIADWNWSLISASFGWNESEIAEKLIQVSKKAKTQGEGYARLTAHKAVATATRRR